jgi:putative MATE family efflux protein
VTKVQSRGELRKIVDIAVPVGLEAVFQMSFNLVDQVIVGVLGAMAVAAVGLSNSVGAIAVLLYAAIGTGSGILVAQAYGRKDVVEVSRIISIGLCLAAALGTITALPLIAFSKPILVLIGAKDDLAQIADLYFRLYSASLPFMILSAVVTGGFRSLNDSKTPMLLTSGAVLLNTILGFMLVLGFGPVPRLGVPGAGLATLISQVVRSVTLVVLFYRTKKEVKWRWPSAAFATYATAGRLIRLTSPLASR